jgi:hypothetical protein
MDQNYRWVLSHPRSCPFCDWPNFTLPPLKDNILLRYTPTIMYSVTYFYVVLLYSFLTSFLGQLHSAFILPYQKCIQSCPTATSMLTLLLVILRTLKQNIIGKWLLHNVIFICFCCELKVWTAAPQYRCFHKSPLPVQWRLSIWLEGSYWRH